MAVHDPQTGWHLGATAPDLLDSVRTTIVAMEQENRFLPLITAGKIPRDGLLAFAAERHRAHTSDRRSFLYLATRCTESAGGTLFTGLAEAERLAHDMLMIFAESLGADQPALEAYEPLPGCQAYPAYVAWLALNGPVADVALALTAALAVRAAYYEAMGRALHDQPDYAVDDRARAFFDFVAAPAAQVERQALAGVREELDAGRLPAAALTYARLLHSYELMFWNTLADR